MEIISIFVNENDLKALSAALNNLNEVFISSLAVFVRFIYSSLSAQCSLNHSEIRRELGESLYS